MQTSAVPRERLDGRPEAERADEVGVLDEGAEGRRAAARRATATRAGGSCRRRTRRRGRPRRGPPPALRAERPPPRAAVAVRGALGEGLEPADRVGLRRLRRIGTVGGEPLAAETGRRGQLGQEALGGHLGRGRRRVPGRVARPRLVLHASGAGQAPCRPRRAVRASVAKIWRSRPRSERRDQVRAVCRSRWRASSRLAGPLGAGSATPPRLSRGSPRCRRAGGAPRGHGARPRVPVAGLPPGRGRPRAQCASGSTPPPKLPTTRGFANVLRDGLDGLAAPAEVLAMPDDVPERLGIGAAVSPSAAARASQGCSPGLSAKYARRARPARERPVSELPLLLPGPAVVEDLAGGPCRRPAGAGRPLRLPRSAARAPARCGRRSSPRSTAPRRGDGVQPPASARPRPHCSAPSAR